MGDVSPEGINQSYALACELYDQANYAEALKLLKICIQLLNQSTIELLPLCLEKLAQCCTAMEDLGQACLFKKFEKMYYEQVLVRKSLDMIDEEKENYQEIIDRVAQLEKLARFCDQNDCANLAVEYMSRATRIRSNCLADGENGENDARQEEIKSYLAKKAKQDYQRNISHIQQGTVRQRGSILKTRVSSPEKEKKKVHWPESLPRYTVEKRWRNVRRIIALLMWCLLIDFLLRYLIPPWLTPYQGQIKTITILLTIACILIFQ